MADGRCFLISGNGGIAKLEPEELDFNRSNLILEFRETLKFGVISSQKRAEQRFIQCIVSRGNSSAWIYIVRSINTSEYRNLPGKHDMSPESLSGHGFCKTSQVGIMELVTLLNTTVTL